METTNRKKKRGNYGRDDDSKRFYVIKFRCRREVYDLLQLISEESSRSISSVCQEAIEYAYEPDLRSPR